MKTRLEAEIPHLVRMCQSGTAWQIYAEEKAAQLAQSDKEMASLPMLLSNAVRLSKFGPPRKSIQPRSE